MAFIAFGSFFTAWMASSIRYRFMIALFLIIMLALFTKNGNIFEQNSLKFQRFPNVIPVYRGVLFVFRKVLSGGRSLPGWTIRKQEPLRAQIDFWSKLEYLSDVRWNRRHFVEHSYNLYASGGCGRSSMRYTIELSERSLTLCHYSFVLLPAEAAAIVI